MAKIIVTLLLKLFGWRVDRNIPVETERCVMIGAPHTTNWDWILVRLAFFVLEIPVKIAVKDFWTKSPIGWVIIPFGGLGIDRSPKDPDKPRKGQVSQMADYFSEYERIAMVIAPEGTRKLRKQWKLGFYHVAKQANVPITYGYLDYANKVAGVGGAIHPSDDMETDLRKIMGFYKNIKGKYSEKFMVDERYIKKDFYLEKTNLFQK